MGLSSLDTSMDFAVKILRFGGCLRIVAEREWLLLLRRRGGNGRFGVGLGGDEEERWKLKVGLVVAEAISGY